jgi:hypothetical protein
VNVKFVKEREKERRKLSRNDVKKEIVNNEGKNREFKKKKKNVSKAFIC